MLPGRELFCPTTKNVDHRLGLDCRGRGRGRGGGRGRRRALNGKGGIQDLIRSTRAYRLAFASMSDSASPSSSSSSAAASTPASAKPSKAKVFARRLFSTVILWGV